ncbi:MAG: lipopolysaccharide biosynthesis protein RfbH [Candidatus Ryanbacteria bacterium]|nr:lipopolysaccharide biosynthesis protein RfbH [Candidatus Ryanbacteria bacterium]
MNKELKKQIQKEYQKRFGIRHFIPGKTSIQASGKDFDWQEMVAMTEAVLDGWWTEGRFADEFEKKFAKFVGVPYCITTTSGSSANLLAISALTSYHLGDRRLKPGDEVITLAAGFPTTVNPLILHRLVPVFVDIDIETCNASIEELKKAISKKTKAIFLPHHLGNTFNIDAVKSLCKKHKLWLVEDCCDALGSTYKGKQVGSFGDLSTFSFYAGHHMTMGEGGAVMAHDPLLASITRSFRDWGREYWFKTGEDSRRDKGLGALDKSKLPADYDHKFIFSEIGFNLKITDIQAALGLVQLGKVAAFTKRRHENFAYYQKSLKKFERFFVLPKATPKADPSWFGFLLTLKDDCPFTRKELIEYLHRHNIVTRMFLAGNVINQPYFQSYAIDYRVSGKLLHTDHVMRGSFWVGCYQAIDKSRREYIVKVLSNFFAAYNM